MDIKNFIFETVSNTGVSGFESNRANFLKGKFEEFCDEVSIDTIGNVIAVKKGNGKGKIMYVAHMDEIGLMVTDIDDKGMISFISVGGVDQRTLVSQEVRIFGKEEVFGVIGIAPPHITPVADAKKAILMKDMKIDTGYSAEKVRELVSIGDIAVVKRTPIELLNGRISVNALDDLSGVAAMYATMERLTEIKHDFDVYFVASTNEEIGGPGAGLAAYGVKPDIAISLDVEFAKTPELSNIDVKLSKGPVLVIKPTNHRKIFKAHKEVANACNIPYQIVVDKSYGGTDSAILQVSNYGIPTADLVIPLRYMHTSVEVMDINDISETSRLMASFVQSFNKVSDLEEFLCY